MDRLRFNLTLALVPGRFLLKFTVVSDAILIFDMQLTFLTGLLCPCHFALTAKCYQPTILLGITHI